MHAEEKAFRAWWATQVDRRAPQSMEYARRAWMERARAEAAKRGGK